MMIARIVAVPVAALLAVLWYGHTFAQGPVPGVTVLNVTETTTTIVWLTESPGDSVVNYGTDPERLSLSARYSAMTTYHRVTLASLVPGSAYYFEVRSTDASGRVVVFDNGGHLYQFATLPATPLRKAFAGRTVTADTSHVVIELDATGERVSIALPEGFSFSSLSDFGPGMPPAGARVAILAQSVDGEWTAMLGLVKPPQPHLPVIGVVIAVEGRSFTLMDENGSVRRFQLPDGADVPLVGETVTVFGREDGASSFVKIGDVLDRVHGFLKDLLSGNSTPLPDSASVAGQVDALIEAVQNYEQRETDIIDHVMQHAPEAAHDGLLEAKERVKQKSGQIGETIEKAKARFGLTRARSGGHDTEAAPSAASSALGQSKAPGPPVTSSGPPASQDISGAARNNSVPPVQLPIGPGVAAVAQGRPDSQQDSDRPKTRGRGAGAGQQRPGFARH